VITPLTEYAGFWRRAVAFVVDGLWIGPLVMFLSLVICGDADCTNLQVTSTDLENWPWQQLLVNELLPALLILWFWATYSATPGKMLLDCDIVDARTGAPITIKQALLRYIGYYISAIVLGLGFLWIVWDKRKQGWHDKLAGTVVIRHDEATVFAHYNFQLILRLCDDADPVLEVCVRVGKAYDSPYPFNAEYTNHNPLHQFKRPSRRLC
jgi:uncharacterized RDD family membrane protein YckC